MSPSEKKKVIVTGVTGQDGSYMSEYLLKNTPHEVYGLIRRTSKPDFGNLEFIKNNTRFHVVAGDLTDPHSINNLVKEIQPDYFINLAAQSFVGVSWDIPAATFEANAMGVIYCLEALRQFAPQCKFYNAGTSEELGDVIYSPQDLNHPLRARSPYGASKIAARQIIKVYRESYNMYAIQGMLYNHESPRRGEEFLTRKITSSIGKQVKKIKEEGIVESIKVGNLDAQRDWSHAEDFVVGIWRMINQENFRPEIGEQEQKKSKEWLKEYLLSSGVCYSVRDFISLAYEHSNYFCNSKLEWRGEGLGEKLYDKNNILVEIDPQFFRPAEVSLLRGDASEAIKDLGWYPKKDLKSLVQEMMICDEYKILKI
jgi:GDPmannose 4,6-dehydratase